MNKFYERLNDLNFLSYKDYLLSSHWKELKKKYFLSDLPKKCLGCGSLNITLHHRSYVRLGNERLSDLIPLCWDCHNKIHKYLKEYLNFKGNPTQLWCTHKAMRKIFGWTRKQTRDKFRKFSNNKKGFKFRRGESRL